MNKLTTINTIIKAAPLALLAVVLSGSAFAGPGNGKKPGPRPDGTPKASISFTTECRFNGDTTNPAINVQIEITDESGDEFSLEPEDYIDRSATAVRKNGGPNWYAFGPTQTLADDDEDGIFETDLYLCPGIAGYKSASAVINVTVESPDGTQTTFSGNCEEFFEDLDGDTYDDMDNSGFDVRELGITC